jgi:hypothetical protein
LTKPKLYRRPAAAAYVREVFQIPCSPNTLAKMATVGGGPEITYVGRWPMYSEAALDTWVAAKTCAARNTSEHRPKHVAAE